jgi:serine/tyrosine/threonine adenylyltransferase
VPASAPFAFDNSYARLPERFFARLPPTPVAAPRLIRLNVALAQDLGIAPDRLAAPEGIAMLAGNQVPEGAEPLAMAYAGHQFGSLVPQLGDGRALLLGEVCDRAGARWDIQLKGSGRTPFSRMGDGRAALGPVLREYIVSEAMAALGIPTTRALAAVITGETVWREGPRQGAVLTRVARSHVRVGTFQFFAIRRDSEALRLLADHVIARLYPELAGEAQPYRALLDRVTARTAALVARWQLVGFIHGVMNTDNTSISGETIDYGPCAFMDTYHPATVYSSIDTGGRYAYGNQPHIAYWNLSRLAQAILPLLGEGDEAIAEAQAAIDAFPAHFDTTIRAGLLRKIGLAQAREGDEVLVHDLLDRMAQGRADFTLTFRRLCEAAGSDGEADGPVRSLFADPALFNDWAARWRARLALEDGSVAARRDGMRAVNPAFIPRNHRVEAAIAAAEASDFGPFEELLTVLARPYDDQPAFAHYADPPRPEEVVQATFCGT